MNIWPAISLTLQLALTTTVILMVISAPIAWWLTTTRSRARVVVEAIVALPLVMPPTVLGFYLLVMMNPNAGFGRAWVWVTGETLAFSFSGLVIASVAYSLPFAVQPLHTAFTAVGRGPIEAAATLGARKWRVFRDVVLPQSRRGILTAIVLSFAHTVGEFGVVLMVGGNIPGKTRVISIEIYNRVETLDFAGAHILSAGLLVFSLVTLLIVYGANAVVARGAEGSRG